MNIIVKKTLNKKDFSEVAIEPKEDIVTNYSTDGYLHFVENMGTIGCGKTQKDAIRDFTEKLETLYEVYVVDDSVELTKDAKKLRKILKENLKLKE